MRRINLSFISVIVGVLVIAVAVGVVFVAIGNYGQSYSEKRLTQIRETVLSYVAQCYALEGSYPADLSYLEDNYGLVLDRDKYIYHYVTIASNMFPDLKVIPIEREES